MKKSVGIVLSLILVFVLSACGTNESENSSSRSSSTLNAIKKKGEITIAVDDTYPPMEFRNDKNELVGLNIDLAKAIGKNLGVKVKHIPTAWDGIIPGLNTKKYDIIMSSMNITDERKKQVDFVKYLDFGQVIVTKKGNPLKIKKQGDLKDKTVGVQIGTTSETAAKEIGIKKIKTYNGFTDAFNDMGAGRLDAIVVGEMVGRYYVKNQPKSFEIIGDSFQKLPVGIAVRKTDKSLSAALTKAVKELKDDGTFDKAEAKWFGE